VYLKARTTLRWHCAKPSQTPLFTEIVRILEKHVHVSCRCEPDEVSITVRDEGQGFDINKVPDPTTPENIRSVHGRGIYVMKALMDEVRFEEGGAVVHMRKSAGRIL
jgi:anti-sigma regulatory factor (Ser/Thr protein kinase)